MRTGSLSLESGADSMANGCSSRNCGPFNAFVVAFAEGACQDTYIVGLVPFGKLPMHIIGKGIIVWDIDHAQRHDAMPLATLPLLREAQTAETVRHCTRIPLFPRQLVNYASVHDAERVSEELHDKLCRNCGLDQLIIICVAGSVKGILSPV